MEGGGAGGVCENGHEDRETVRGGTALKLDAERLAGEQQPRHTGCDSIMHVLTLHGYMKAQW